MYTLHWRDWAVYMYANNTLTLPEVTERLQLQLLYKRTATR